MTYLRSAFSVCSAAGVAAHSPDSSAGFWAWPWSLQSKPHTPCQNPQPLSPHSVTQTSHHTHTNFYTSVPHHKSKHFCKAHALSHTFGHITKKARTYILDVLLDQYTVKFHQWGSDGITVITSSQPVSLGHVYVKHMFWSKHTVRTPVT